MTGGVEVTGAGTVEIAGRVDRGRFVLDVDLRAEPGEVVALIGPNGCGKSTLLNTVAGLLRLQSGLVRIGGTVVDEPMSALDAQSRMAVREQLHDHLAAFDGVAPLIAHDLLDVVGLANRVVALDDGRIAQDTDPQGLRRHPGTEHAAAMVGVNVVPATARDGAVELADGVSVRLPAPSCRVEGPVEVVFSPRAVTVNRATGEPPEGAWASAISGLESLGDHARVRLGDPVALTARAPLELFTNGLRGTTRVWVSIDPDEIEVFPR